MQDSFEGYNRLPLKPVTANFQSTITAPVNKRIILAYCDKYHVLITIIESSPSRGNIAIYKNGLVNGQFILAVAWYDFTRIVPDLEAFQAAYLEQGNSLSFIQFKYAKDIVELSSLTAFQTFRFMDDCYDTFYISFKLSEVYGGTFLEDLFLQVSSFGNLYEFSPLPGILNAYSCRYCNIRTAFEVRRLRNFQVGSSSVTISGSLIELHERSFECPILDINGEPIDLSDPSCRIDLNAQEWNKYQQLKHRRLASIPFSLCGVPERNRVVIERIQTGEDLRTTIMIRNIPNKVTFDELKEVIDETSKGEYDFLYLRFDFENHCNVGYAFISFADPRSIIRFYPSLQGMKWSKFKSDKVCELAYARIQGRENLILKFQRSKVMEQSPDYRPRFYATEGMFKGEELEFTSTKRDKQEEIRATRFHR